MINSGKSFSLVPANCIALLILFLTFTFSSCADFDKPLMVMVRIPEGSFMMGSYETADNGVFPPSLEKVSAFYMSKYPVTHEQYEAVMGARPSGSFNHDKNLPVDNVNWYNGIEFCNRLSILEGLSPVYSINGSTDPTDWGNPSPIWDAAIPNLKASGYRLPTDIEREYACKAGTTTAYNTGANITKDQANFNSHYGANTTPVGKFGSNRWGLYDMHGNVAEWCWDWHPGWSNSRILRGGSWTDSDQKLRSAYRDNANPGTPSSNYGFRVVRRP